MEQKQKNDEARELAQLTLMPEIRCLNILELRFCILVSGFLFSPL